MSKLREDYQFVYDTLSLRASMLVSPLGVGGGGMGGGVGGGGSKSESTASSSRDSAVSGVSGDKTALGDKTVPVTTTDITTGTGTGTGDSVKVDVVGVSVGVNATAHDTVITSASSSEKVQGTYSTNSTSDPLTSSATPSVTPSRSNVVVEDEDGNVMALLQSLESRRKFQVREKES